MSSATVRFSKQLFAGFCLLAITAVVAILIGASSAGAQADNFLSGDGHDPDTTMNAAGTYIPNAYAPVSGAVPSGATAVTIGSITAGSNTGNVTFAANRLVMVYQSNGVASTPTSGDQTAYPLSNSTAGHWEFARISTVAGSTLNFTAPLIKSYAAGSTQVIAVPEWNSLTVSNAGVSIQPRAWDGSIGGVVVALVKTTAAFSAAGTVTATGSGLRGGVNYLDNVPETHNCGAVNDATALTDPLGLKGEGFNSAAYSPTTSPTALNQLGRGNQLNAGGGGNCFNAAGGGGGNVGQGGTGGNSLNQNPGSNQAVGGLGGAALTFSPTAQLPMGGGGGAGDRDDGNVANGGRGGGVIVFRANTLTGSGTFTASGSTGGAGNSTGTPYDGAAGGGAGGTIVLRFVGAAACGGATASGGTGGANGSSGTFDWTPGGGGGGGAVYVQKTSGTCNTTAAAGNRGTGGSNAGASNGGAGSTSTNTNALTKPTVTLAAPVNGTTYGTTTPAMSGTATASSTVYVYIDGVLAGTTTASAGGAWSYSTAALSQGNHTIKVFSDVAGSQSDEVSASFTVDTVAPAAPTITTPATSPFYTSDTTPTVAGTAEAGSTVKVYEGATLLCTATATGGNWTCDTSALGTGSHTITAYATDAANNTSVASGTKAIVIDTTAPTVSLTAPANGSSTNDNTPAIAFTVTDTNPGTTTFCIVDGGAPFACTSGSSLSTLADGSHTLQVRNTDLAGNVGNSAVNTFTVDTTAPAAPVITTPATSPFNTNDTTPTVGGTAEAGSSVSVYEGATLLCTATATGGNWTCDTSVLSVGTHTITAYATDAAGNTSAASGAKAIVIDTTAPAAPVITTPATSPFNTNDTTPTVAGTAEAGSTVKVYEGATLLCTATATGGNWTCDTSVLATGSHTITATATDAANNTSVASGSKTIVIDTTAPAAPVITTPATSPFTTNNPTPTIGGTAEAGSTVTVLEGATVLCTTTATGGNWSCATSALSDGSHTITATATDAAGNTSTASGSKIVIVDTAAPAAPVITNPSAATSYSGTHTPTISGTAEANSTVKLYDSATLVCTTTANGSGNWSCATSSLADGPHNLSATATDAANNTSVPSSPKTVIVDTTAPVVTITAPTNGSTLATTTPSFTFTVVESNPSANSECNIDNTTWVSCSSGYTPAALSQGAHSIQVRHTDLAGNVGTSSVVNFTVDTVAPAAPTITSGPNGPVASTSASFTFTGEAGGTYECYVDSPANWAPCTSPVSYSSLAQGSHTVHVRQTDSAGNVGPEATQTWSVDTVGPPAPNVSGPSGTTALTSASISFTDSESPVTYFCKLDTGSYVSCTSPVDLAGLSNGAHSFSVYAVDALGNAGTATTINWTVDTSAFTASILTGPSGTVATNNNTFTFTASVTSGTTYQCSIDGAPASSCSSPLTTGVLADGAHTFQVLAVNGGDNSPTVTRNFTIDTTAPSIAISSPTNGQTTAPTGSVSFTATDSTGPVTTTCAIDGDTPVSCSSPFSYSGLSNGPHSVTVSATDGVGNATSLVRNFVVDATPPDTSITANPDAVTNQTGASFSFTSTEGSSTFECKLDTGAYSSCSSPQTYSGLAAGSHTFLVRATDQYGNTDASPASYTWTIDLTAPAAPAITTPATDITTADTTPSVGGTAEPDSTVRVYEGATLIGTATTDGSGNWSLSPDPTLTGQGPHTLTAYATDPAGNVSSGSAPRVITIDTIAPSVAISAPVPDSLVGTDTPLVAFAVSDDNLDTVECSVDGGVWVACTSAWTTPSLSDGPHTASVRATDDAGNTGMDTTNFTVDNTDPATPTVDTPATDITTSDVRPTWSGDAEANSTVRLYVNGSLVDSTTASAGGRWTYTPSSDLSDGVYAVYVTAEDAAGNLSADSNTRSITVDTAAPADPTIDLPAADGITSDRTPDLGGTAESGSTVKIYDNGSLVATVTAGGGIWTWTPSSDLSSGVHAFVVTATDAAGNTSNDSNTRTLTIDFTAPAAPAITTPSSDVSSSNPTQAVGGTAEPDSSIKVYDGATLIGTATADGSGNWSLSPDPTFNDGTHPITATATDAAGNVSSASQTRNITIDTTAPSAPVITAPADGSVTGDNTPAVSGTSEPNATVKVYDGLTLVCTATANGSGDWSCNTSTLTDGTHSLQATATDGVGNTGSPSNAVLVTVDTTVPTVAITGPLDNQVVTTHTPSVTFVAADSTGVTLACSVDGGPFSSCTSPFTTPTLADGSHTVTVRATDGAGNTATDVVPFTVDTTAPTTTITGPSGTDNDSTPTFTFTADQPATFECRVDGGSWTSCSSPITLGPLSDGPHTLEVRATDANGNVESPAASKSWTIDATAPAKPVVTAPADLSTITDDTPTITGTAEPNSSVQVFVDGNPIGTVTASSGGAWTITSAHLADGSHNVTARATDGAGNQSVLADSVAFTIDTTPPNGTIAEQNNGTGNNPTFVITPNEGDATISCSLDGATSSPCSSPFTPTGTLAPGTHTLVVTFTDPHGNSRQVTYTFTIAGAVVTPPADPTACDAKGIAIANLAAKGSKVTISGYARLRYAGQTVSIKYKQSKKPVATAVIQADGSYSTSFKAPAKKLWKSNKTLYQASVGGENTTWTKLTRRVQASTAKYSGGKLTVTGQMIKPFLKTGIPVVISARTGCSDPWKTIGNIKAKKNGTFTFTTNYTPSTGVIFVKFRATLASDTGKKYPTGSFVMPVIVK